MSYKSFLARQLASVGHATRHRNSFVSVLRNCIHTYTPSFLSLVNLAHPRRFCTDRKIKQPQPTQQNSKWKMRFIGPSSRIETVKENSSTVNCIQCGCFVFYRTGEFVIFKSGWIFSVRYVYNLVHAAVVITYEYKSCDRSRRSKSKSYLT